jgi:hypothetical protein
MLKYVLCAVIATAALGIALHARGPARGHADGGAAEGEAGKGDGGERGTGAVTVRGERPEVVVSSVDGVRSLTVRHLVAGSVSRARLVYDAADGHEEVAASQTDCRRSLAPDGDGEAYTTPVLLTGPVPTDAAGLRLIVESETGERIYPLH